MAKSRSRPRTGAELVAAVAAGAAEDQPLLLDAVLARLREVTPEFFADPSIADDMRVGAEANILRVHRLLCDPHGYSLSSALTAEGRDLTQGTVRHGIPLIALLEAYRTGQGMVSEWWRKRIEAEAPDQVTLVAAIEVLQSRISHFVDAAAAEVRSSYEDEQAAWSGGPAGRRTRLVREFLAGAPLDVDATAQTLNHPLRAHHIAVVLWREYRSHDQAGLEAVAGAFGREAGGVSLLTVPAGASTLWAWLSCASEPTIDSFDAAISAASGVRAAVSGPHQGPEGFRQAHEDALEAQRVARLQGRRAAPITRHADVHLAALVSSDPRGLWRFVCDTLGPLADADVHAERLRATLGAYLASGGSTSGAARRLGIHRNTVSYRLRTIEDLLGPDFDRPHVALELALELVRTLGPPPATD